MSCPSSALIAVALWCMLTAALSTNSPLAARNRSFPFRFRIKKEDIFYDTHVIPEDHQVSSFLYRGETQRYFFLIEDQVSSVLTIMVTPCTSSVTWSVHYRHENNTFKLDNTTMTGPSLAEFRGQEQHTFSTETARQGLYIVQVTPLERETYIHLYASRQPGAPIPLRIHHDPKIRLQKRTHRNRLSVRWDQSMVDPQQMYYCLVVNTRRNYASLCEAQGERYGVIPPQRTRHVGFNFPREDKTELARKAATLSASRMGRGSAGTGQLYEDIVIGCVGPKLSYTVDNLEHGKVYYFNLFAIDRVTNFTFSYGNATLKYDRKVKPYGLRDNKPQVVNLRRLDGRATFRYKVSGTAEMGRALDWHVMPCGGSVEVEIRQNKNIVIPIQYVDGYARLRVNNPQPGQRYTMRLLATDPEELRRITGVEVLATMRNTSLPQLPEESRVHEYSSLKTCDSVTVGWVPAPEPQAVRYCVSAALISDSANPALDMDFRPRPNQCNLESRLRETANFAVKHCHDISANDHNSVLTHKISKLKPGREYLVQVTVKKSRGKTLSYDLLRLHTKSRCH